MIAGLNRTYPDLGAIGAKNARVSKKAPLVVNNTSACDKSTARANEQIVSSSSGRNSSGAGKAAGFAKYTGGNLERMLVGHMDDATGTLEFDERLRFCADYRLHGSADHFIADAQGLN